MKLWDDTLERGLLHDRRRMLIIQTAARIIAQRGWQRTSIDDIAAELKVSKPTIYYYLKNKENILLQIVSLALEQLDAALQGQAPSSGLARTEYFLQVHAKNIIGNMGMVSALVGDHVLSPGMRKRVRAVKRQMQLRLESAIEQGVKDGSIKCDDPKLLTLMIFGAFNWIPRWYRSSGRLSIGEIDTGFLRILHEGISNTLGATSPKRSKLSR